MTYSDYSYPKRNASGLCFVLNLMKHIAKTCNIKNDDNGLSIGGEDCEHEIALFGLGYKPLQILNNKKIYDAEKDEIPFSDNTFDYVFIKSVIEHIANTDLFLSEICRVLKPGGKVIILTPDYQKQGNFIYDDYTHIKPFTLGSLKMALLLNGFHIWRAEHFWYYKKIWENKIPPNGLNCRLGYWLTEKTKIKYFRWGSDRQLFVIGEKR
jgi:SAM-dependent methyltransferase